VTTPTIHVERIYKRNCILLYQVPLSSKAQWAIKTFELDNNDLDAKEEGGIV